MQRTTVDKPQLLYEKDWICPSPLNILILLLYPPRYPVNTHGLFLSFAIDCRTISPLYRFSPSLEAFQVTNRGEVMCACVLALRAPEGSPY